MKTFVLGLMVASAMLVSGAVAQAGFVNGGASFAGTVENPSSGTALDTRAITALTKTAGSGDFTAAPDFATVWANFSITDPMASPFSLTTAGFGSFTGTLVSDTGLSGISGGNGNRTITYTGSFSAGSLFPSGVLDATTANLTITLNQSTTSGNTFFSNSVTLTAFGTSAAVPEPASMAIFGLGAIGFAARRFRRK